MGYMRSSVDVPLPKDFKYHWIIQVAMKRSNVGGSTKDKKEYDKYMRMENPFSPATSSNIPFPLPNPFEEGGAYSQLPR